MDCECKKVLCFDMDGTVADLYNFPDWLEHILAESTAPFEQAEPMWNMDELRDVLIDLWWQGWEIRVITWLSKGARQEYEEATSRAKIQWLKKHGFPYQKAHTIKFGRTKADCIRTYIMRESQCSEAILIDDNEKVRKGWTLGRTIDPQNCDLIAELKKLLVAQATSRDQEEKQMTPRTQHFTYCKDCICFRCFFKVTNWNEKIIRCSSACHEGCDGENYFTDEHQCADFKPGKS